MWFGSSYTYLWSYSFGWCVVVVRLVTNGWYLDTVGSIFDTNVFGGKEGESFREFSSIFRKFSNIFRVRFLRTVFFSEIFFSQFSGNKAEIKPMFFFTNCDQVLYFLPIWVVMIVTSVGTYVSYWWVVLGYQLPNFPGCCFASFIQGKFLNF